MIENFDVFILKKVVFCLGNDGKANKKITSEHEKSFKTNVNYT